MRGDPGYVDVDAKAQRYIIDSEGCSSESRFGAASVVCIALGRVCPELPD